jgi:hypothetical protein
MVPAGFWLTRGLVGPGADELAAGRRALLRSLRSLSNARRIFCLDIVEPLLLPYKGTDKG